MLPAACSGQPARAPAAGVAAHPAAAAQQQTITVAAPAANQADHMAANIAMDGFAGLKSSSKARDTSRCGQRRQLHVRIR